MSHRGGKELGDISCLTRVKSKLLTPIKQEMTREVVVYTRDLSDVHDLTPHNQRPVA